MRVYTLTISDSNDAQSSSYTWGVFHSVAAAKKKVEDEMDNPVMLPGTRVLGWENYFHDSWLGHVMVTTYIGGSRVLSPALFHIRGYDVE